jgi:hypothetical protein
LLPADRVQVRFAGNEAVPVWLGTEDNVWIRALIADLARLDGRPYREVATFLREPPRVFSPGGKRQMAIWTLLNLCTKQRPAINAFKLRAAVTETAQQARDAGRFERSVVIASAAQPLGLSCEEMEEQLLADLPGERRILLPEKIPDAHTLAAQTNLALAQGLLRLASEVDIELHGSTRTVVRQIHLMRLLCTMQRAAPDKICLHISGAFSLFRHTTLYGRALASILPMLAWCERFDLHARCMLRGRIVRARLRSGDPIAAGQPPRCYDSRLEERFARDFSKANLDWDLVREPEPIEAGDALIFPDFAVVHRREASKRFLLEIVGFWTPDYLQQKLRRMHSIDSAPLVLCIDRRLNCSSGDLPVNARIVWFEKRIDPRAVLSAVES